MTPVKTALRRASTNSASFLSTLNLTIQPLTHSKSQSTITNESVSEKSPIDLNLFGGRILEQTLEQLTKELEDMFEV